MTTTADTNSTTWHDLADQLTPRQVADLQYWQSNPDFADPASLLKMAQRMIRENNAQVLYADIVPPADCIGEPSDWGEWDTDLWERVYTAWKRTVGGYTVEVRGQQFSDGRVERVILVDDDTKDVDLDAAKTRMRGTLLLQAAERLDSLSATSPRSPRLGTS